MSPSFLALLSLATTATSGDARIAVLIDLPAEAPRILNELEFEIAQELHDTGVLAPVTQQELVQVLSFEAKRQLVGCDTSDCFTNMSDMLRARYLIAGTIGSAGEDAAGRLALRLIDLAGGEVVNRCARDLPSDPARLREAARNAVAILVRPLLKLSRGDLVLLVSEEEAKVELDDKTVGLSPVSRLQVAGGTHELRVELDGFRPVLRDIRVIPGDVVMERIDLVPSRRIIEAHRTAAERQLLIGRLSTAAGIAMTIVGGILFAVNQGDAASLQRDVIDFNNSARTDAQLRADLEEERSGIQLRGYLFSGLTLVGVGVAGFGWYAWQNAPDPDRYAAFEQIPAAP